MPDAKVKATYSCKRDGTPKFLEPVVEARQVWDDDEAYENGLWADDSRKCYDLWLGINRTKMEWRCVFCGRQTGHMEQVNGHYEMTCCRQVMESCCTGETGP